MIGMTKVNVGVAAVTSESPRMNCLKSGQRAAIQGPVAGGQHKVSVEKKLSSVLRKNLRSSLPHSWA